MYTEALDEAGATVFNDPKDPLSVTLAEFTQNFNVNTTSAFVAAQQAVLGFKQLPESASKTFIFTGNITNDSPIANLFDQGVGKVATARIIQSAASAYKDKGFKYVLASEIERMRLLMIVDSIMVMSGRRMDLQNIRLMERPMGRSIWSSLKAKSKVLGNKPL